MLARLCAPLVNAREPYLRAASKPSQTKPPESSLSSLNVEAYLIADILMNRFVMRGCEDALQLIGMGKEHCGAGRGAAGALR